VYKRENEKIQIVRARTMLDLMLDLLMRKRQFKNWTRWHLRYLSKFAHFKSI